MPHDTVLDRPPVWSRIHPDRLAWAQYRVDEIVEQVTQAMRVPGQPDARVRACLQTTGMLVVVSEGRRPALIRGRGRLDRHLRPLDFYWNLPAEDDYRPLVTYQRWPRTGTIADAVLVGLARCGFRRASDCQTRPSRMSDAVCHQPMMAPEIRRTPRVRPKTRPYDFTRPLARYAQDSIARASPADVH